MNRIFSINHIDFLLSPEQVSNSKTLQIIVDHSNKKNIDVKLPKDIQNVTKTDLNNILYIMGLKVIDNENDNNEIEAFIKQNLSDTLMYRVLERYDVYTGMLRYFSCPHNLDRIMDHYIESRINTHRIDTQFLTYLSKSKFIDKVQNHVSVSLIPSLLRWQNVNNMLELLAFTKILEMLKHEDRYQFIDISHTSLKRINQNDRDLEQCVNADVVFDPRVALSKLDKFSFGIIDEDFMNHIDHKHVFFAGGSLISCFEDEQHEWSDIDLWVNADDTMNVLLHTFKLLNTLKESFNRHGYGNLLWSCSNNVITCYCVNYNRNIQIVMVKGDPSKNVDGFDFDYVKAYMKNRRIFGSIVFIKSFIEKKICDVVVEKLKEFRVVKSLIKGYRFSDQLMQNSIISDAVLKYNEYKLLKHAGYQICPDVPDKKELVKELAKDLIEERNQDIDVVDMMLTEASEKPQGRQITEVICKTRNKFYYPSLSDYNEFANRVVPYHESRAYYMINMMCGHKIVTTNLDDIEKYLTNTVNADKGFEFTTQYTAEEREAYNKIKKIDNIDLDNMYLLTNIYINPGSPQIRMPIMYQVDGVATKFDFVSDELVFDSEPFDRYNNKFYQSADDPRMFNVKLRKMRTQPNHPEIEKIFRLIDIFDTSLRDLFSEPFTIKNTENGKDFHLRGYVYQNLIKGYEINEIDDDEIDDNIKKRQNDYAHQYAKFHLLIDKQSNLLTEIYEKGKKVQIAQLSDMRNIIKYKSRVILRGRFEHLAIQRMQSKHIFPKLSLTRIDVL